MEKAIIIGKKQLSERISKVLKKNDLTRNQIERVVDVLLSEIKNALIEGSEVKFFGYFSLKTMNQRERVAMNLRTKERMNIPAKRVPKAKFSEELKREIAMKK